jgi:hypothetical protein
MAARNFVQHRHGRNNELLHQLKKPQSPSVSNRATAVALGDRLKRNH